MLSDEEIKAMDSLKVISEYAGDNYLAKEHRRKLKLLIELVEKQSREIEELKEDRKKYAEEYIHNNPWLYKQLDENYILRTEANKLYNKKWKDKIKAKIKEISEEWAEGELDGEWYEFMKYHLESLLGKE